MSDNANKQARIEGSGHRERDTDSVTEYPLGAGGGFGGGTARVVAREIRGSNSTGD